jgi:hypothetical protein
MQTVEIRIEGHIDKDWVEWLEDFSIIHQPNKETVLTGKIVDQAALYGLIAKLRDLGLKLLSVNCEEVD